MNSLTSDARARGFHSMQENMTAARRVQRRLSAGRRPALPESLSVLDAVRRLVDEAHRAKNTMQDEQLNPADISLGLLFSAEDELQEYIGNKWLGPSGKIGEFIAGLEELAGRSSLSCIGIIWALLDREANKGIMWAKPIVSGPDAARKMELSKGLFKSPHSIS